MEGAEDRTRLGFYTLAESEKNIEAPAPQKNGGLYTGQEFRAGAGWANVPIVAESHVHTRGTWAPHHIPGGNRGGNNKTYFPDHRPYADNKNYPYIQCSGVAYSSKLDSDPYRMSTETNSVCGRL